MQSRDDLPLKNGIDWINLKKATCWNMKDKRCWKFLRHFQDFVVFGPWSSSPWKPTLLQQNWYDLHYSGLKVATGNLSSVFLVKKQNRNAYNEFCFLRTAPIAFHVVWLPLNVFLRVTWSTCSTCRFQEYWSFLLISLALPSSSSAFPLSYNLFSNYLKISFWKAPNCGITH